MKISCPKYGISLSFVRSLNAIKSSSVFAPAVGAHSPRYLFRSALNSYRRTANSESSNWPAVVMSAGSTITAPTRFRASIAPSMRASVAGL